MKLRFNGSAGLPLYHGFDHTIGKSVSFSMGEEQDVSEEKAIQLFEDFPGLFSESESESESVVALKALDIPPENKMIESAPIKKRGRPFGKSFGSN